MAIASFSTANYLNFGTASQYQMTSDFAISTWLYYSTDHNGVLMAKWLSYVMSYQLQVTSGYKPRLIVAANSSGGGEVALNGTVALTANSWNHVLAGRDNTTSLLRIYTNGVATGTVASSVIYNSTTHSLLVGKRSDGYYYGGTMFDARLYNIAPSLELAQDICYGRGRDTRFDGLVLRTCLLNGYAGNSMSSQTVYDHSIYKNHIAATGSPTVAADPYSTVKAAIRLPTA